LEEHIVVTFPSLVNVMIFSHDSKSCIMGKSEATTSFSTLL
jgi:hypothetical protein